MRSLSIIVGTAALAIHGVAGAALPVDVVKPNGPALLDHEILQRSESHCGTWGLCSWDDHGPTCCDSSPGDPIGTNNVNSGIVKHHPSALPDHKILKRVETNCGDLGLCSWGDRGPICCDFPPTTIGYPGMYAPSTTGREQVEDKAPADIADGDDGSGDEEAGDGQDSGFNHLDTRDALADPLGRLGYEKAETRAFCRHFFLHKNDAKLARPVYRPAEHMMCEGRCIVFRPKAPGNRCLYTDQRGLIERLKKNFGWSNFQACYPLEVCPQKRDAIPDPVPEADPEQEHQIASYNGPDLTIPESDSSPEADNIAEEVAAPSPDTSELQPRQIGFSGYDQPPKKPVQYAARTLQAVIHDEDIRPRGNCWVLQRDNHGCRKKLQNRKGVFPLSAFKDCYDKKKCPKKRDVILESTSVEKVEERKIMCDLSSWPDHRFLDFKAAALRGQVRIGAGIRDCCFYIPTSGLRNTCGRLRRGQFSPTLFMGCYDIGPCSKIPKREALHEIDVGPSDDTIVERAAIPPTHEFYGLEPCQHGTKEVDKTLPGCKPRPGKDCVQRYVEWKCNLGPNDDCMRPRKKTVCKRKDEVEERAFVPLGPAPQPRSPKKPRCEFGKKLAPKMEKGCTTASHHDCVKRKINKDCLLTIGNICEIVLESVCKASADDSANNVKTQIHVNPCSWGWEIRKEKGKDKLFCLPHPRRSTRRSAVAELNQRETLLNEPGLKEGGLPESAKRDVPAAVEYYSASTSTSTPSSDITLNYLKCKDFCKFDKSLPPICLPNCYVIDGQIQLDAPLLLVLPSATVTTSEASIDTSMATFQTSTTSALPVDTLLASRDHIEGRAPPGLVIDHRPPRKCKFGNRTKFRKPGCRGQRDECYLRELLCYRDIREKSLNEREDVAPDAISKAITDRTNTPAINTAAFRKLDGNILPAVSVEAAKKVANKAAGHTGKRTESDLAPKDSAVEDSYGEGEDKKAKRAIEERGLDVSQNLPKGHSEEDMFDNEKKDRRGDGLDTSREISSSDADMNPLNIRSNTFPLHKCGSAICLLRRAFNSLTSKRYASPKPLNIKIDLDQMTKCLKEKRKLRDCMQEFIVHKKRLVERDRPPPQSTKPHHVAKPKPKPKHPPPPKPKPKPKPKPADQFDCGGAVVCKLKRALGLL